MKHHIYALVPPLYFCRYSIAVEFNSHRSADALFHAAGRKVWDFRYPKKEFPTMQRYCRSTAKSLGPFCPSSTGTALFAPGIAPISSSNSYSSSVKWASITCYAVEVAREKKWALPLSILKALLGSVVSPRWIFATPNLLTAPSASNADCSVSFAADWHRLGTPLPKRLEVCCFNRIPHQLFEDLPRLTCGALWTLPLTWILDL